MASVSRVGADTARRGGSFLPFSCTPLRRRARPVNSFSMLDLDGVGIGGKVGGTKDDSDRTAPRLTRADKGSLATPLEERVMLLGEAGCVPVLIRLASIPSLALAFGMENFGDFKEAFSALMTTKK